MRSISMIHQLGMPAIMPIFHFGAFSIIASSFWFQSFIEAILLPGLVIGLTISDVCFFKIPLKSPSMCFRFLMSFVLPPTANAEAL